MYVIYQWANKKAHLSTDVQICKASIQNKSLTFKSSPIPKLNVNCDEVQNGWACYPKTVTWIILITKANITHSPKLISYNKKLKASKALDFVLRYDDSMNGWKGWSPSRGCSDLKGASLTSRLLVEFPSRSGREEDTDTTEGFLLHFNTDGYSSTTGKSSVVGNSSCGREEGGQSIVTRPFLIKSDLGLIKR